MIQKKSPFTTVLIPLPRAWLWLVVLVMILGFFLTTPVLFWSYNIERAGRLLEPGLRWPSPRQSDSLPQLGNPNALKAADEYLNAAIYWRQTHPYAYRLKAYSYMAQGEWEEAATQLEQAEKLAPRHALIAWELGLAYQQIEQLVKEAPQQELISAFASGEVIAPSKRLDTPFCDRKAQSCYMGVTTFIQPLAEFAEGEVITASTLFLHAPAQVKYTLRLPMEEPALYFLLGLDPAAREWGTDGASFQIWVEASQEPATLVYEETIDAQTAIKGWVPGWADLSPWEGETITLVLGSATGAAGNGTGDWFGWGELGLTTVEAARYAAKVPDVRKNQVWRQANLIE